MEFQYILPSVLSGTSLGIVIILTIIIFYKNWMLEEIKGSIKHEYDSKIEILKNQINLQSDILKANKLRYFEKQFDLYNDIWVSLCDLESTVNKLWEVATMDNVEILSEQIYLTRTKVKKGALIIENRHYRELNSILNQLDEFRFGKMRLLDIRRRIGQHINNVNLRENEIRHEISHNNEIKDRLLELLGDMMNCLKRQLTNAEVIE